MEQIKEAVYLINDERYLHLRENGAGVGFATYNKVTGEPLESGQIADCLLYTSQSIIVSEHYFVEVVEMLKYHVAVCDDEKSDPVSYTHLDVYKRQTFRFLPF